jgi:hypothetical protein
MIIYVVTHVSAGIHQGIHAFSKKKDADAYEKYLCQQNSVPYEAAARDQYYEENEVDDDIIQWTVEVDQLLQDSMPHLKTKVKKTGTTIEVIDYGENFVPRYWSKPNRQGVSHGYQPDKLELQVKNP